SIANIHRSKKKRLVIIGGGFAGMRLAKRSLKSGMQVVVIDKNNYHQFQPLFYQVATAGLEPSSISFPLRKVFHRQKGDIHFRMAALEKVNKDKNIVETDIGYLEYDYLVIATGVSTNYFGLENIHKHAVPMKTVSEAIYLRNRVLKNFEEALNHVNESEINALMNVIVVGGGPTGVELAGALAEMKKYILPKDYPELDFSKMQIRLFEASDRLLAGMSDKSGCKALKYLQKLDVEVKLNTPVSDYDGKTAATPDSEYVAKTLIWAAGVSGRQINGIPEDAWVKNNRIKVDEFNRLEGSENIFAIGDIAYMETANYPQGHPQVAQVAIQQADLLSGNFRKQQSGKSWRPFRYKDKGSLATIGRKLAVADLPYLHLGGFTAWILWLLVHLMAIVGVRNRLFIFLNWMWNYITYDQSLRLLIRPKIFKYNDMTEQE
ncbi:MAG TPA: NAD(P)/FAD-dependent oxidoreductase, partial [Bacteroidales bacterium]|nr:NAD(P)/FAD-dependent oxidoreductase [Bacteroidales bacterium]